MGCQRLTVMSNMPSHPEPVTDRAALNKTIPQTASGSRRRIADESSTRILYVEDDQLLSRFVEETLRRSGYDVDTADDGAEAWAALQDRPYHLLITDNQMPRITGLELIHRVRLARLTIPIILASGTVGALPVDDLPWLQCAAVLAKPFTPEQLVLIVHEVLRTAVSAKTSRDVSLQLTDEFQIYSHDGWGINE